MAVIEKTLLKTYEQSLSVHPNSTIQHADIDPDEQAVAFICDEKYLLVQSINSQHAHSPSLSHRYPPFRVSIKANKVATTSRDSTHHLAISAPVSSPLTPECFYPTYTEYCALSTDAELAAVLICNETTRTASAAVFSPRTNITVKSWQFQQALASITFSPDARYAFILALSHDSHTHTFLAYETMSGIHRNSLHTDCSRPPFIPAISSDLTADNVVIADCNSLRIWNVNNIHVPVKTLPSYIPQTAATFKYGACAISNDGSRVVSAIDGNCFAVWDTRRSARIATLTGHEASPLACAISSDGSSIFTVAHDKKMCRWRMPHDSEIVSVLEHAYGIVLNDPELLDERFVLDHLSAKHVTTVSDLLAGHNLILLAIRTQVITRDNIYAFGGSSWFIQDNLYLPASKLVMENGAIIDAIFHHAESLGIIKDGYCFRIAREIRSDMEKSVAGVGQVVSRLARRLGSLEARMSTMEKNIGTVHTILGHLVSHQQSLQEAIIGMSYSLKHLQDSIAKSNRRNKQVAIAKCFLSFVSLADLSICDASFSGMEVFSNLDLNDFVPFGAEGIELLTLAPVDLSNLQLAQYAFSEKGLSNLPPLARNAVLSSIEESGFKNASELVIALQNEIKFSETYGNVSALVDIGSSSWMSELEPTGGKNSCGTISNVVHSLDKRAQKCFQYLSNNNPMKKLSVTETKLEMNELLKSCDGLSEIDCEEIEDIFFETAEEDAADVSGDVFVKMFRRIRIGQQGSMMEEVLEECGERFREAAKPGREVSLRIAVRLVCNLQRDLMKRGVIREGPNLEFEEVRDELRKFDRIGELELQSATESLFRT